MSIGTVGDICPKVLLVNLTRLKDESRSVVRAQLAEWLLLTPLVWDSNPVIDKFFNTVFCLLW